MKENGFRILRGVVTVSAPCSLLSSLLITFEEVTVYLVGQSVGWLGGWCVLQTMWVSCAHISNIVLHFIMSREEIGTQKNWT